MDFLQTLLKKSTLQYAHDFEAKKITQKLAVLPCSMPMILRQKIYTKTCNITL